VATIAGTTNAAATTSDVVEAMANASHVSGTAANSLMGIRGKFQVM